VLGRRAKAVGLVLLVLIAAGAIMLLRLLRHGFSAHDKPTRIEAVAARTMRRLAAPSDLRGRKNPLPLTPEVLAESRAHFADHCAICHGNDGKGQTAMGPNFYPHAPDMTLRQTQSLSDGELFAIIENGIRLTGMPAWGTGTAESAYGSWTLVHFIRHLPQISSEELEEMARLNPKSPEELKEEEEEQKFLEEEGNEPTSPNDHHH
jgi:mono/diheme cytochrome c family protein